MFCLPKLDCNHSRQVPYCILLSNSPNHLTINVLSTAGTQQIFVDGPDYGVMTYAKGSLNFCQ